MLVDKYGVSWIVFFHESNVSWQYYILTTFDVYIYLVNTGGEVLYGIRCYLLGVVFKRNLLVKYVILFSIGIALLAIVIAVVRKIPLSNKKSITFDRKGAEQGDANAQFELGDLYIDAGLCNQAIIWYRKAAEQGHARAQFELGAMYYEGLGVPRDSGEAISWYRKAAEQDHAGAQFELGAMYYEGLGIPKDGEQAIVWYRKAAEQGHIEAQLELEDMYDVSLSVPRDREQAI